METSESAKKLRIIIEKAIEDHKLTRSEYDMIIHQATEIGRASCRERV